MIAGARQPSRPEAPAAIRTNKAIAVTIEKRNTHSPIARKTDVTSAKTALGPGCVAGRGLGREVAAAETPRRLNRRSAKNAVMTSPRGSERCRSLRRSCCERSAHQRLLPISNSSEGHDPNPRCAAIRQPGLAVYIVSRGTRLWVHRVCKNPSTNNRSCRRVLAALDTQHCDDRGLLDARF